MKVLVPGDVLAVTEVDYDTGEIGGETTPGDYYRVGFRTLEESYRVLELYFQEHPVVMRHHRTGAQDARRISDFLKRARFP